MKKKHFRRFLIAVLRLCRQKVRLTLARLNNGKTPHGAALKFDSPLSPFTWIVEQIGKIQMESVKISLSNCNYTSSKEKEWFYFFCTFIFLGQNLFGILYFN